MNNNVLELLRDLQVKCITLKGDCIGDCTNEGCDRAIACLMIFGNEKPCDYSIEEMYNKVMEIEE